MMSCCGGGCCPSPFCGPETPCPEGIALALGCPRVCRYTIKKCEKRGCCGGLPKHLLQHTYCPRPPFCPPKCGAKKCSTTRVPKKWYAPAYPYPPVSCPYERM